LLEGGASRADTMTLRRAILFVLLAACSTPSVPLPPPSVDTSALRFASPTAGTFVLNGEARVTHANARFYVIDRQNGEGVIATAAADGSFATAPLTAAIGDVAEVYFETPAGVPSEHTCVTVLVAQPLVGAACP
jgi:hypothetical protein